MSFAPLDHKANDLSVCLAPIIIIKDFWGTEQIKAFVTGVDPGTLYILDLYAEMAPIFNMTESFYGTPFIWCMLGNFGGGTGIYGNNKNSRCSMLLLLEIFSLNQKADHRLIHWILCSALKTWAHSILITSELNNRPRNHIVYSNSQYTVKLSNILAQSLTRICEMMS